METFSLIPEEENKSGTFSLEAVPDVPSDMPPADVIRNAAMGRIDRQQASDYLKSVGADPAAIDRFGKGGMSPVDAVVGGAQQFLGGALSGFGDEAAAGVAAPVVSGISQLTDNPLSLSQAYDASLSEARKNQDAFKANAPITSSLLGVGGNVAQALALGGAGKAAAGAMPKAVGSLTQRAMALVSPKGLLGRAAAGAAGGAAVAGTQGAVTGYGEGENADMRSNLAGENASDYAKIGAAFGAAAPVVAAGAKVLTQPMKKDFAPYLLGQGASGVDDVGKFAKVQKTLEAKYGELRGAEKAAWDKVRAQSSGKGIAGGDLAGLQDDIIKAQSGLTDNNAATMVDRILGRWNKFIESGQPVPAEELIGNRAALSKASVGNAGLRSAVSVLDDKLSALGIDGIGDAISKSKERFHKFDDVAPIASALGADSTAADFGKAVFGAGSLANATKAAQRVKEVLRASGDAHLDVKQALDQAVVHRIMQTASSAGDETVWLDKAFREVNGLKQKNPELWGMLSSDTQEGLSKLATSMNEAGKSGKMDKVAGWTFWALNKALSPLGVRQVVQKPSTTASQVRVDFQNLQKMMKLRPDEGRSMLDKLIGR